MTSSVGSHKLDEENTARIVSEIEALMPVNWRSQDLLDISTVITAGACHLDEILEAVISVSPDESNLDQYSSARKLAGVLGILALLAARRGEFSTMRKAVIGSLHLQIDVLQDSELTIEFCQAFIEKIPSTSSSFLGVLLEGDQGIAWARLGQFAEAVPHLKRAVGISIETTDYESAARYGSELGRSYFELGDHDLSGTILTSALENARRAGSAELESQIKSNLRVLSSLNN